MKGSQKMEAHVIEGWLRDMGLSPVKVAPPEQISWQFTVQQPLAAMNVAGPSQLPRAVIVIGSIAISPEHVAAYGDLDADEKMGFTKDLNAVLNREYSEYMLIGATPDLSRCPAGFQVIATRFNDGVTLDSFARTVSSVYKAQIAGIQCVQLHLTPKGSPSASFDFRRMGGGVQ